SHRGLMPALLAAILASAASSAGGSAALSTPPGVPQEFPDAARAPAATLPLLPEDLQALGRRSAADSRLQPWQRDIMKQLGGPPPNGSVTTSRLSPPAHDLSVPGGTWVDVNLGSTYYNRYAHAAIYDPVRSRTLVFGGYNGSEASSEVWELSLSGSPTWSLVNATGAPPGQWYLHTAIY